MSSEVWVYDLEVFPNFFLATFKELGRDRWRIFTIEDGERSILALTDFIKPDKILAGFNNFSYDDVILRFVLRHWNEVRPIDIYNLSMRIIEGGRDDTVYKLQYSKTPWSYSIDVFQLLNKKGALKEWSCREGVDLVVEANLDFTKPLHDEEVDRICDYCANDVLITEKLLTKKSHLVTLRETLDAKYELGKKVHCLSEAGIAQHVLMTLHQRRTDQWMSSVRKAAQDNPDNKRRKYPMKEIVSKRVMFSGGDFLAVFKQIMRCNALGDGPGVNWQLDDPVFEEPVQIGQKQYKIGVGGLHSVDAPGRFVSDDEYALIDLDVTSYYPSIIIVEGLYPKHIGPGFIKDFTGLRDARVAAKRAGDDLTNQALKIIINSTFGKLNDAYSPLRSIPDALRVTINGQLMLLMLIEALEAGGAEILSANTDGVTVRWKRTDVEKYLDIVMATWSRRTGHELERTDFQRYCRRDVNSYVALKVDGKVKAKGALLPQPDTGKWDGVIVKKAAERFLLYGEDPAATIQAEDSIVPFIYYQRVQNGGSLSFDEDVVGRTARWYLGQVGRQVYRVNPNGKKAKVPHGTNAVFANDITGHDLLGKPTDLDPKPYIKEAWKLINSTLPKKVRKK